MHHDFRKMPPNFKPLEFQLMPIINKKYFKGDTEVKKRSFNCCMLEKKEDHKFTSAVQVF